MNLIIIGHNCYPELPISIEEPEPVTIMIVIVLIVLITSCRVRAAAGGRGAAYLTPKLCCDQNGRAKVEQRRKMGSKKRKSAIARKYARAVPRQWCSFVTTRTPHLMGMME